MMFRSILPLFKPVSLLYLLVSQILPLQKERNSCVNNKVEKKLQNVEETFDIQNLVSHCIPTPDDNQNDIPPPVSGREYLGLFVL